MAKDCPICGGSGHGELKVLPLAEYAALMRDVEAAKGEAAALKEGMRAMLAGLDDKVRSVKAHVESLDLYAAEGRCRFESSYYGRCVKGRGHKDGHEGDEPNRYTHLPENPMWRER